MFKSFLFVCFVVLIMTTACGPTGDDDSTEASPTIEPQKFIVNVVGEYWGQYGLVSGYGIDAENCSTDESREPEILVSYDDSAVFPPTVDCSNVGEEVGFSLNFTECDFDLRIQRLVDGCSADEGHVDVLLMESVATYSNGSNPNDVSGSVYLFMSLDDGSTLEVYGPFSHCDNGQPCEE